MCAHNDNQSNPLADCFARYTELLALILQRRGFLTTNNKNYENLVSLSFARASQFSIFIFVFISRSSNGTRSNVRHFVNVVHECECESCVRY